MAYWPWVIGLGAIALVASWPGLGTIMIFFLPGLLVAQTHRFTPKAQNLYWAILAMTAVLVSALIPVGGLMASMELILMAWALRYALVKSLDIPKTLILIGVLFTLVFGSFAQVAIYMNKIDISTLYSSVAAPIDQALSIYDLDEASKEEIKNTLIKMAPSMVVISIIFFAYLNCVVAIFLTRRINGKAPLWKTDLGGFRLPEPFVWVGIVGGAGALFGHGALYAFAINILIVVLALYLVQGAGIMKYFMNRYKVHVLIQAIVFLLISFSWYGLLGLTVVGVSDVWTNVRQIPVNSNASESHP